MSATAQLFEQSLFDELLRQAANSPRRRAHHALHALDEPCHRLIVGMLADSYVPPHRHLQRDKAETLLVLQGRLGLLTFDEQGEVQLQRELLPGGLCLGADLPVGLFHALVALSPACLFFECKAGPFIPLGEGERPVWAPREDEPDASHYRRWMSSLFD